MPQEALNVIVLTVTRSPTSNDCHVNSRSSPIAKIFVVPDGAMGQPSRGVACISRVPMIFGPNIIGGLGYIYSENSTADNLFARNGALYWSVEAKRGATMSVTERAAVNIVFDASLSNSIYSGGKFLANNMLVRFIVSY